MVINFTFIGVNVLLNWVFIYKAELGFIGSPIATAVTKLGILISCVIVWFLSLKKEIKEHFPKIREKIEIS